MTKQCRLKIFWAAPRMLATIVRCCKRRVRRKKQGKLDRRTSAISRPFDGCSWRAPSKKNLPVYIAVDELREAFTWVKGRKRSAWPVEFFCRKAMSLRR